jgi:peptidyl-prolyl cis-trans isomerase-like protein 2
MVKHQKEKQYQSAREHRVNSAIRSGRGVADNLQQRLPFSHCALSLQPFTQAVCNPQTGILFESSVILPFVLQWKRDPCTGKALLSTDLVTLHMEQNETGQWECPILNKAFTDHVKVVAIRQKSKPQEAYVYSFQAYQTLNLKPRNFTDLMTGEAFHPKQDVIVLHDPEKPQLSLQDFYHIRHADEFKDSNSSAANGIRHSATSSRILAKLDQGKKTMAASEAVTTAAAASKRLLEATKNKEHIPLAQDVTGVALTTSAGAASFTSTDVQVNTSSTARLATAEEILAAQCRMLKSLKENAYVRLVTNMGALVLEIHCGMVPRTAMNFLGLCEADRYDKSSFHRLIPGFMVQGGKAPAGKPDTSLWGEPFVDEFDDRLKHTGRGIVAMANAGANTNKQQFYITLAACSHLDRKHSVFGTVVKGMEVLDEIEKLGKDAKDRPVTKVEIISTEVLASPVDKALALEKKRIQKLVRARDLKKAVISGTEPASKKPKTETNSGSKDAPSIGRYLKDRMAASEKKATTSSRLPAPPKKTSFGNFSGW